MVTLKDYLDFRGINLDIELKGSATDNPTRNTEIYISKITEFVKDYIKEHYVKPRYEVESYTDLLKKIILYQIEYMIEVGNIEVVNLDKMKLLSDNGSRLLKNAGYNLHG